MRLMPANLGTKILKSAVLALAGAAVLAAAPLTGATTGAPAVFSYQGRLTDGSGNLLGGNGSTYYFKFSIWDSAAVGSGNRLWPLGLPGIATSTVADGVFNVSVGDTANGFPDALTYNFNDSSAVYLQVQVSSDGVSF